MKLTLIPSAVYLFKPENSTNQDQSPTKRDQPTLYLDKFNKHVGIKQFV